MGVKRFSFAPSGVSMLPGLSFSQFLWQGADIGDIFRLPPGIFFPFSQKQGCFSG
jgi:hypothetical protein